jgi:hypothetical protein
MAGDQPVEPEPGPEVYLGLALDSLNQLLSIVTVRPSAAECKARFKAPDVVEALTEMGYDLDAVVYATIRFSYDMGYDINRFLTPYVVTSERPQLVRDIGKELQEMLREDIDRTGRAPAPLQLGKRRLSPGQLTKAQRRRRSRRRDVFMSEVHGRKQRGKRRGS